MREKRLWDNVWCNSFYDLNRPHVAPSTLPPPNTYSLEGKKGFFSRSGFLNCLDSVCLSVCCYFFFRMLFIPRVVRKFILGKSRDTKWVGWNWERKKTVQNSLIQNLNRFGGYECLQLFRGLEKKSFRGISSPWLFTVYIRPSPSCILRTGYPDLNNKGNNVRPPDEGPSCFSCYLN